jgi:hypothetical protein
MDSYKLKLSIIRFVLLRWWDNDDKKHNDKNEKSGREIKMYSNLILRVLWKEGQHISTKHLGKQTEYLVGVRMFFPDNIMIIVFRKALFPDDSGSKSGDLEGYLPGIFHCFE